MGNEYQHTTKFWCYRPHQMFSKDAPAAKTPCIHKKTDSCTEIAIQTAFWNMEQKISKINSGELSSNFLIKI